MPTWFRPRHGILAVGYLATVVLLSSVLFGGEGDAESSAVLLLTLPASMLVLVPFVLYPLLAVGMVLHVPDALGPPLFWSVPAAANMAWALLLVRRRADRGRPSRPTAAARLARCLRPRRATAIALGYITTIGVLGASLSGDNDDFAPYALMMLLALPLGAAFLLAPGLIFAPMVVVGLLPAAEDSQGDLLAPYWGLVWAIVALGNVLVVRAVIRTYRASWPVEMRLNRSGFGRGHECALRSRATRTG